MYGPGMLILLICLWPFDAEAHGGDHLSVVSLVKSWDSRGLILFNLLLLSVWYIVGQYRRKKSPYRVGLDIYAKWRPRSFFLSMLVTGIALCTPVATLSEQLGWVHMIQHSLLMVVAAPLFIAGAPGRIFTIALPSRLRRLLWQLKRRYFSWTFPYYQVVFPFVIWVVFGLTLWLWHLPVLYQAALQHPLIHDLQHLAFFFASCLFWQTLIHPLRQRRLHAGVTIIYVFVMSIHTIVLGALMALSPVVWYPHYRNTTAAFGLAALKDQQIAGYIMWMPACLLYAALAIAVFANWMRHRLPPAVAVLGLLLLTGCSGPQSMFAAAGAEAVAVLKLWWILLAVALVVLAVVTIALLMGSLRRREREDTRSEKASRLRMVWRWLFVGIGASLALLTGILVATYWYSAPDPAATSLPVAIEVEGKQYWWAVRYFENGKEIFATANEIVLPAGRTVRLRLISRDVIHSFWVPGLSGKMDLIPGSPNVLDLHAEKPGIYRGQCAEYCGIQHALMAFLVIAKDGGAYEKWIENERSLARTPTDEAARKGQTTFMQAGCAGCHTVRGFAEFSAIGPDLTHLAGRDTLAAATMRNSRGHLTAWVIDPQGIKPGNLMPASALASADLGNLIAYLTSLK